MMDLNWGLLLQLLVNGVIVGTLYGVVAMCFVLIYKATQVVNNEDKRRLNLYRKLGKQDYDQPSLYHLVMNMSRLSIDKAVDLACELIKGHQKVE